MNAGDDSTTSQALPAEGVPAAPGLSDPERWVELHGDYLFRCAMMRLRDASKAEDAVQETFLAALKGGKSFAGRSAEKSWLVGILKVPLQPATNSGNWTPLAGSVHRTINKKC